MATEFTPSECPVRVRSKSPVAADQILIVLSPLPLASHRPSGLMATELTQLECPVRVRSNSPVAADQILIVASPLPLASHRPSGLMATELTSLECPVRVRARAKLSGANVGDGEGSGVEMGVGETGCGENVGVAAGAGGAGGGDSAAGDWVASLPPFALSVGEMGGWGFNCGCRIAAQTATPTAMPIN